MRILAVWGVGSATARQSPGAGSRPARRPARRSSRPLAIVIAIIEWRPESAAILTLKDSYMGVRILRAGGFIASNHRVAVGRIKSRASLPAPVLDFHAPRP